MLFLGGNYGLKAAKELSYEGERQFLVKLIIVLILM